MSEAFADPHAAAQSLSERLPGLGLRRVAACVWIQRVADRGTPYPHRTAPDGCAQIVGDIGRQLKVVGPLTGPSEEILWPGTVRVGIRLRPGAFSAVFGVPAVELVDNTVELDDLWGPAGRTISERLAAARSPQDAAAILESSIASGMTGALPYDPIVVEAVRRLLPGRISDVSALARSLDISARQLRRRCEIAVGVAPKFLHRILRMQGCLALTRHWHDPSNNLARLAARAGFADQAHLTREFQRLTGRSPRTALHEAAHHCGPNHDHAASDAPLLRSLAPQRGRSVQDSAEPVAVRSAR